MLQKLLAVTTFCACMLLASVVACAQPPSNAGFERGVNLSHWFAQVQSREDLLPHLHTHVSNDDLERIRALGLDHVRLPVDPAILRSEAFDGVAEYRKAVDGVLSHGLNVVLDVHPSSDFKEALGNDPEAGAAFVELWKQLAGEFAYTDPTRVRFELLNEPIIAVDLWGPLQGLVAHAVREAAPRHTIVLCGARWSGVDQLLELEPIDDANLVYNFHFYEPHQFTHQAATWGARHWREIKGLPYPVNEECVRAALARTHDPAAITDITHYAEDGWNTERVHNEIARAAQWAQRNGGLTLTCNEFGVYMKAAPPDDRAAWLRDVRDALESHGIGWTMWDYNGGFAIVRDGEPDEAVVKALGLDDSASGDTEPAP